MIQKFMRKNEKGFTLVELMVVVAILGVLVAIAIPVYNNVTANAKIKAHNANVRTIQGAVQVYLAVNSTSAMADMDDITVLVSSYIAAVPTNPTGGAAYTITDGVVSPAAQ